MIRTDALSSKCEMCGKDLIINLMWDAPSPESELPENERVKAIAHARHDHWRQLHRTCAICGKALEEEVALVLFSGRFTIHDAYTEVDEEGHYEHLGRTTLPGSRLVSVHPTCNPESTKG